MDSKSVGIAGTVTSSFISFFSSNVPQMNSYTSTTPTFK
jgi:hypothetical protein